MGRLLPLPHVLVPATCGTLLRHCFVVLIAVATTGAVFFVNSANAQTGPVGQSRLAADHNASLSFGSETRDTIVVETARRISDINSPSRDDTPIITADGRLMFFNSTRFGERPWAHQLLGRYDDDIYVARSAADGNDIWREPTNLRSVNTSDDDGIVAISSSGHLLYYLSLRRGWQKDGGPFYQAERHGSDVSGTAGLGGGITRFFAAVPNKGQVRIFGASMSPDGTSFYFATTAYSQTDDHEIWVSHRSSTTAEWQTPENLGPRVNAGGGSYAPFIAADGNTLYF
ncbi:MAG: PD40 domain-containing protein, partial [bacterium]|nr:PD40 domain-containing protein [Candidatus Kapabacteria bacterium]